MEKSYPILCTLEECVANMVRATYPDIEWYCYITEITNRVSSKFSEHDLYKTHDGEIYVIKISPECHADIRGRRLAHEIAHIVSRTSNSDHSNEWRYVYNRIIAIATREYTHKYDDILNRIKKFKRDSEIASLADARDMLRFDNNPDYYIPDECDRKDDD